MKYLSLIICSLLFLPACGSSAPEAVVREARSPVKERANRTLTEALTTLNEEIRSAAPRGAYELSEEEARRTILEQIDSVPEQYREQYRQVAAGNLTAREDIWFISQETDSRFYFFIRLVVNDQRDPRTGYSLRVGHDVKNY